MGIFQRKEAVTYLPIYMLMFLKSNRLDNELVYKLDLSGFS